MGVLLVGCGRLGSAIVDGWLLTGAVAARDLMILTPSDKPAAARAEAAGASINPPMGQLKDAGRVVLAVKPGKWREATGPLLPHLAPDAVVVSVMAGVGLTALSDGLEGRPIARVMPTTSVGIGRGAASIWAGSEAAHAAAEALFAPMATVVALADEGLMDAATAVSGSGQAYVFAFVEALTKAAAAAGFDPDTAARLARATVVSASAALEARNDAIGDLIAEVASPGGTTQAGLKALNEAGALDQAVASAVQAALKRARELG